MDEPNKISNRPIFLRDDSWERFPDWTRSSRILAKDCGLPPLLDASDLDWIDWAKRRLGSFSWPSFTQSPLLGPFDAEQQSKTEAARQQSRVAEVQTGPDSWRINLHVSHFSPEEITVVTKEGYLLISGNHEERQDEHQLVSRCFTRRYKLPRGVDLQHISSSLSADGLLSVEAPTPAGTGGSDNGSEVVVPVLIRQAQSTPPASLEN